jgi:hypothetical protein
MTRVMRSRPSLYLRLTHALHHTMDHVDHLAGAPSMPHLIVGLFAAGVALTHSHTH